MNLLQWIKERLNRLRVDPDELDAFRHAIPSKIGVNIREDNDYFILKVTKIDEKPVDKGTLLITQAKSLDKLDGMVDDLVLTYKRIPTQYRPYFKRVYTREGARAKDRLTYVKA